MSNDFSATGSYLGYLFQARLALLLMLQEGKEYPELRMSIERFDDVAFENGDSLQLIQTKHHQNRKASLTDASVDLWKTIRIWSERIIASPAKQKIKFCLVTTSNAADGSVASKLRLKEDERNPEDALQILTKVANISDNKENIKAYEAFLALSEDQKKYLINNLFVFDQNDNIQLIKEKIKNELRLATRPKFLEPVLERIEGWWFKTVVDHLAGNSNSDILSLELQNKINDIQETFRDDNLPADFLEEIIKEENELREDQRIFIEQLRLVAISQPRIKKAISDYYRAFQQRSKWLREGIIFPEELNSYERRLIDEWQRAHLAMKENLGEGTEEHTKINEGRSHYNQIEQEKEVNIRPRCTEPYIMRGTFHMLANKLDVGWHPDFIEKLSQLLNQAQRS